MKLSRILIILTSLVLCVTAPAEAAGRIDELRSYLTGNGSSSKLDTRGISFGIKFNRAAREYPDQALADIRRFAKDRIGTVMLSLPWSQWADAQGQLNQAFVQGRFAQVLDECAKLDIPVVISVHCSFWGEKGNWSIPVGIRNRKGFESSASVLLNPAVRDTYIAFLTELISATRSAKAVVGFNILNEPVAATRSWVVVKNAEFKARWEGVVAITSEIRRVLDSTSAAPQTGLIVGTANGDPGQAEYVWDNYGKVSLKPFWEKTVGVISGQYPDVLEQADRWYPASIKVRTEGFLSPAVDQAWRDGKPYQWEKGENGIAMNFDYDAVYDYEGLRSNAINNLVAAYIWRIGSPDGSQKHLWLFDHRRSDAPTPYYFALRDLASGIDSFEDYPDDQLPNNRAETLAFDPRSANGNISSRWHGSGLIAAVKEPAPDSEISTMSAAVSLKAGQSIEKEVISRHWTANGVSLKDRFRLSIKSSKAAALQLYVRVADRTLTREIRLGDSGWQVIQVPFSDLGLSQEQLSQISQIGLKNPTDTTMDFLLDEFLIR